MLPKITTRLGLAAVAAGLGLAMPCLASAADATLDIDLAKPGHAIPASFYGLMTEEINYSYDGGLFAELIRNRTFQDPVGRNPTPPLGVVPQHWSVVGSATAATNDIDPVNDALPVNLRLKLSGSMGGVANDGYWGIAVRPSTKYTATFYARAVDGFSGAVTASLLTDKTSQTVASATTHAITGKWVKYTVTLTTPADAPTTADARFVLSANGKGAIDFSFVSLFPPTYQEVPNGLRPDLMKLMAGMHPAFIRLPGGNYVEGSRFADRFNWKHMIGPADQRPGHQGCWSYRSSDGFGLPEYLLWCKQLGAEPVLALFAGYTLNGDYVRAGSPEYDLYIQEALQEIEYVTGPAASEWGKRRAADGFPEPFPLHYVEIGNEDFFDRSGSYEGRFAAMAKAIRAKYPQLKIIATTPVKSARPDLVDDHLYAGANQMFAQSTRYDPANKSPDGRKPDGVKVFMGEWATQGGSPTPNLRSALGDAAFVMGLERNSDDVVMQCYAPLLTNTNPEDPSKDEPRGWQWGTNLIGYDAMTAFGSPSYYVLAMFGANRGDVMLPSTLDVSEVAKAPELAPHGMAGVGTYETEVEYTDLSVTAADGHKISSDNLANDPSLWHFTNGRWSAENGVLKPRGQNPKWALTGDTGWDDYTVRVRARKTGGDEGFILLWHGIDGDNYRWWNVGGWGNTVARFEVAEGGGRSAYGPSVPFAVETGRWYNLRLEIKGHHARGFIDDQLVMEADDEAAARGASAFASASYVKSTGEVIVKVVNADSAPLTAKINLRGARTVGSTGKAIVLAGDPGAINSTANPTNVAPQEEPLRDAASSFTRTFPAHSITLLRFPAK